MKKHSSVLVEFSQSIYELYFFGRENENESNVFIDTLVACTPIVDLITFATHTSVIKPW